MRTSATYQTTISGYSNPTTYRVGAGWATCWLGYMLAWRNGRVLTRFPTRLEERSRVILKQKQSFTWGTAILKPPNLLNYSLRERKENAGWYFARSSLAQRP